MKLSLLVSIMILFSNTAVRSEPSPTYTVKDFDVFGVKLGMSFSEATQALTKALDVELNQLEFGPPIAHPVTGKDEPRKIAWQGDSYRVYVYLTSILPVYDEGHSSVVSGVNYRILRGTPLFQFGDFSKKYGEPSYTWPLNDPRLPPQRYAWCSELDENSSTHFCNSKKPSLVLDEFRILTLSDGSYGSALRDYLDRKGAQRKLTLIERALRKYYKHKNRLPTQQEGISILTTEIEQSYCHSWAGVVSCIHDPYLSKSRSFDSYGKSYKYKFTGGVATVISMGKNKKYDNCMGDDLCINIDPSIPDGLE